MFTKFLDLGFHSLAPNFPTSWKCCRCVNKISGLFFQEEARGLGFGAKKMVWSIHLYSLFQIKGYLWIQHMLCSYILNLKCKSCHHAASSS